jgi:hypothetical protein
MGWDQERLQVFFFVCLMAWEWAKSCPKERLAWGVLGLSLWSQSVGKGGRRGDVGGT